MMDTTDLVREIDRQDAKHGPTFNAGSALGRIRLGIACLEDEVRETLDAWRDDRGRPVTDGGWIHTREEALQVAALAMRLVRQIDAETHDAFRARRREPWESGDQHHEYGGVR